MIDSANIVLKPFGREHLDRTLQWTNDPELCRLLNRLGRVSPEEHLRWFEQLQTRRDTRLFAIETPNDRRHVGNVWLVDIDERHRKAELRIVVGERESLNHGVGSDAIGRLCEWAFDTLKLQRVYAYVLDLNPRARRAFEKAGFVLEGTLRRDRFDGDRYVDVFVLGRLAG